MRKRSSLQVTLVLLGMVATTGCGHDEKRDVYASREDCIREWNDRCEESPRGAYVPGAGFLPYFYGPSYRNNDARPRPDTRAINTETVARGGFGRASLAHATYGG